jgi:protein O-mannosyl-transferase
LAEWREAVRLKPDNVVIADQLAWTLATLPDAALRNGAEAVALAQHAVELSDGQQPTLFGTLAAALAEQGRFSDAIAVAEQAVKLAKAQGNTEAVDLFRAHLKQYRDGRPYRDVPPKAPGK